MLKILLIDDNRDLAFLLSSLIKHMGYDCVTARDGLEGISRAKEIKPDVIICDLGLPKVDGFEVAKVLMDDKMFRNVHFVALTGLSGKDFQDRASLSGFHSYLTKPAETSKIKQILEKVCLSKGLISESPLPVCEV